MSWRPTMTEVVSFAVLARFFMRTVLSAPPEMTFWPSGVKHTQSTGASWRYVAAGAAWIATGWAAALAPNPPTPPWKKSFYFLVELEWEVL